MSASSPQGINTAWSTYRQCAATSAYHKAQIEQFTRIGLWLGILGALIGTVGQAVAPDPKSMLSKVAGIAGSVAVTLAGVAVAQAAAGNKDKLWVKFRAAGEAIKSSVYLYCASVPPFDVPDRAVILADRVEKAVADLQSLDRRPGTAKEPPGVLTVAGYIQARVDEQTAWYTQTAVKYQKQADFWRMCSLAAACVGGIIGAVSAMFSLAPWVALLSTLVTSVTAYVKGQRYEAMISLYQTTALRLSLLKDKWLDSGKTEIDKADRDAFIQACEQTMALENGAWMAGWLEPVMPQPAGKTNAATS